MLTYADAAVMNFLNTLKREEGQGMVEYGLLLGLIAAGVIVVLLTLGPNITTLFENVVEAMAPAMAD
jgi:pilus assembly protein Flp/PilA